MTMTEIIVAAIPKTINQVFCGLLDVSSETPAPTRTTAEERGNIPTNVPMTKDVSGTRAAAIKKISQCERHSRLKPQQRNY